MKQSHTSQSRKFHVEIIKPSHYDDDGYVIQWRWAFMPSNSLACLWAMADDASQRRVLGDDVELVIHGYDEMHTVVPVQQIIRRIKSSSGGGIVLLAGVQSNQFPRAADLAAQFRDAGIQVAIGGFHVSGCISMLPEIPPDIKAVQAQGVTLFAGEAEGAMDGLLQDAIGQKLQPVYNFLNDLPGLEGQVTPYLPKDIAARSFNFTAFDAGRGCPFRCSFCTIINVQGRTSRYRSADDVEHVVRTYAKAGVDRFFITDDNMARNKNWEAIFDRLIELREQHGLRFKVLIQVDTQCHKIKGFIEKAVRAGVNRVFIGMESVNAENLAAAKKFQNNIREYRKMLQAWRALGVVTYAGYILGFPADTPESIEQDIRLIQQELPVDILEFFVLTPLPGSADHRDAAARGEWMHPDMNLYDSEHVTMKHPRMTDQQWSDIYRRAWHLYYTPEHIETLMRRGFVTGSGVTKVMDSILMFYGTYCQEGMHPLQCGLMRRKVRTSRRPGRPLENPLLFYPKRIWETLRTHVRYGLFYLNLMKVRRRIRQDPLAAQYTDESLQPIQELEITSIDAPCDAACDSVESTDDSPAIVPLAPFTRKPAAAASYAKKRAG
jgi:hypothetical protein